MRDRLGVAVGARELGAEVALGAGVGRHFAHRVGPESDGRAIVGIARDRTRDQRDGDTVFEQGGVRVFVDALSLPVVDGTQIDLVKQRLGEQFVFRNPNASAECGCGESFTTDESLA